MTRDELTAFREADPLRHVRLDAVDPGALDVLRRGIMMSDQEETPAQARAKKPHRRLLWGGAIGAGVVAAVATAATVGGCRSCSPGGSPTGRTA